MISLEEAYALLERHLRRGTSHTPLALAREATIERPWGWVMHVDSKEFIGTGDPSKRVLGQGPVFVLRESGRILETGSALDPESALANFEASGDPWEGLGTALLVFGTTPDADVPEGARQLHRTCGVSIVEAGRRLRHVSTEGPWRIDPRCCAATMELLVSLSRLGFHVVRLPARWPSSADG